MSVAWDGPSDTATSSGGFMAWQRQLMLATLVCHDPRRPLSLLIDLPLAALVQQLPLNDPVGWFVSQSSVRGHLSVEQCATLAHRLSELRDTLLSGVVQADECLDTVDWLQNEFAVAAEQQRPIRWG